MLIAQLIRHDNHADSFDIAGNIAYCACDPFDGERLTSWHPTIMGVDDELQGLDKSWGLMLARHAGESDVPPRIIDED